MLRRARNAISIFSDLAGAFVFISFVAAAAIGLVGLVGGLLSGRNELAVFGGGVLIGVVVGIGVATTVVLRGSHSIESQRGYRWLAASYCYSIDPHDPHFHAQRVDVHFKAIRDGVHTFTNQYLWSGSGVDDLPQVLGAGQSIFGPLDRSSGWRHYVVNLEHPLKKGQEGTISVLQQLCDSEEKFQPFLAKTVQENLDELELICQIPPQITIKNAWAITRDGFGPAARELSRLPLHFDALQPVLRWVITKPHRGYNYEISWTVVGADPNSIYSSGFP